VACRTLATEGLGGGWWFGSRAGGCGGEAVVVAGAGDCLRYFAALIWRGRMLVSLEGTAVEFLEVLAGQALIGSLTG